MLYFLFFVFVFTFFQNFTIIFAFLLLIIVILFITKFFKKFNIGRQLLLLFISFTFVLISVFLKNYFFFENFEVSNNFDGNGQVIDILGQDKFLFEDSKKQKFVLYSKQKHNIGDEIYLIGDIKYFFASSNFYKKFDFDFFGGYYMMKGIYGNIYQKNFVYIGQNDLSFSLRIKKYLRDNVVYAYGENKVAGLVLGMMIGDKSLIPEDEYQNFINSSLVHIIAVSGSNLVLLIVFVNIVLFFIPFYFRQVIVAVVCIVYAGICGMDSSILRALIMSLLIILSIFGGRRFGVVQTTLVAIIIMLLINPYYLIYDLGFGLSFGAVRGIQFFQKINIWKNKKISNFINPIIGAYTFTLPIILLYTGKISIFGFVSNIFVLPIVGFVMIYGFLSIFIYQIIGLDIVVKFGEILINYIYWVGNLFAQNNFYLTIDNIYIRIYFFIVFVGFVSYRYYLYSRSLSQINKSL